MDWLVSFGRVCYGIAIVAFGLEHLYTASFVTRVVPWWPRWILTPALSAYLVGILLIAAGAAILLRIRPFIVALLLGTALLASVVVLYGPLVAADPHLGATATNVLKALALSGGAFAIARTFTNPGYPTLLWIGRAFFGIFLFICGIEHFLFVPFVKTLVPTWMPGSGEFWTYFAGVALMAGGAGLVVPKVARLAALLSGAMIFAWVFMVHIPRAMAAKPGDLNELTAVFEAIAMSGIGFVLAGAAPRRARAASRA
jgi:uncharacterized membrane protein